MPAFPLSASPTVPTHSLFVEVADINGDGKPDLVVVNELTSTLSVLLNTTAPGAATPTFAPEADFATGVYPVSVAIADLNGDGKPDLVAVSQNPNILTVLLNTTAPGATKPTFAPMMTFATGPGPSSVAIADLNGDGRPDLVVTTYNTGFSGVSVFLNTTAAGASTLTFAPKGNFPTTRHGA